jgi:molybdopterin/thiamine biosynthesis adenylyltransferase
MRNANILIINMRALANEVAKNLVLAGIGSLTVLDPDVVVEDDLGAQFFVSEEHVGINVRLAHLLVGVFRFMGLRECTPAESQSCSASHTTAESSRSHPCRYREDSRQIARVLQEV